jgi:hypothetical protein
LWPSWNQSVARLAVVDIADPSAPSLVSHVDLPIDVYSYGGYYWGYTPMLAAAGEPVVQHGSSLVFLRVEGMDDPWVYYHNPGASHPASLQIVDLSQPATPHIAAAVALPEGGGHTGLVTQGDDVLLTHWEPIADLPGKVRFYLDRVNVAVPNAPLRYEPVNVPGSLVSLDAPSSNLLTVDYERETIDNVTSGGCSWGGGFTPYDPDYYLHGVAYQDALGSCTMLHRKLRLCHVDFEAGEAELLDEKPLPDGMSLGNMVVGDDRVFATVDDLYWYYDAPTLADASALWTIGGLRDGALIVLTQPLADVWWSNPIAAQGQRMVAVTYPGSVVTVDTSDLSNVVVTKHGGLPWYTWSAEIVGDRALLAQGEYGVYAIDLTK